MLTQENANFPIFTSPKRRKIVWNLLFPRNFTGESWRSQTILVAQSVSITSFGVAIDADGLVSWPASVCDISLRSGNGRRFSLQLSHSSEANP